MNDGIFCSFFFMFISFSLFVYGIYHFEVIHFWFLVNAYNYIHCFCLPHNMFYPHKLSEELPIVSSNRKTAYSKGFNLHQRDKDSKQ